MTTDAAGGRVDFFTKLVGRTSGRWPVVGPKFETLLASSRGNADALPELARGELAELANQTRSPTAPREAEPLALVRAPEPTPTPAPEPAPQPTLHVTITKLELHAAPERPDRRA